MTTLQRLWRPAVLLLALVASGCVSTRTSPRGTIPTSRNVAEDPRGAWVQITTTDGGIVQGELLAVDLPATAHVLTTSNIYQRVDLSMVRSARVEAYRNEWSAPAAWGALGTVSTVTHGFVLGLSVPVWGAVGASASVAQSRTGFFQIPAKAGWDQAQAYARFPAGLPDGLDLDRLRFIYVAPVSPSQ